MGTQLEASSEGTTTTTTTTPKSSRYRSVRRAAADVQDQWSGEAAPAKPSTDTIARSMSRYRRPKTAATPTSPTTPKAVRPPSVPALPLSAPTSQTIDSKPVENTIPETISKAYKHRETPPMTHKPSLPDQDDEDQLSEAEKARIREDAMRKLTMAERPKTSSNKPNKGQDSQSRDVPGHGRRTSWKDKLGLSHHSKKMTEVPPQHINTSTLANAHADSSPDTQQASMERVTAAPGIDAPVSAVNAGERRVLVKYKSNSIKLPVTPTTRVKDIIYSAANCFSGNIDPKSAILVESFSSLGLERPLRRYEHVREVLNSWSTDGVHSLILSESPYDGASQKLEIKAAPSTQPKDAKFYLYHSSKPGKWDKRYITLRADGQVVLSKKAEAKEAKDFTNVCHMSDFDIYTPTDRQLSKNIRPPKKICFAIKSQQKSSMFLSTENFVRFFATNDATLAQGFHDAVHGWRSWYLVHVLEVGKQSETADASVSKPVSRDSHHSFKQQNRMSTDSIPYQLGSFKPLVEFGQNADPTVVPSEKKLDEEQHTKSTRDMFMRKKKIRDHAPPPSSFPVNLPTLDTKTEAILRDDDSTFSPDSLLGRTYSQRQAAQRAREAREAESDPFLSHGLLKNLSPTGTDQSSQNFSSASSRLNSRSNTVRSHDRPSNDLSGGRSNSVRQMTKPLVDLTPTYREPPQHAHKGHGVKADAGVPLIEAATGLEPIPGIPTIPSATTWRREEAAPIRPTTATHNISSAASITSRRRANTGRSQHQHQTHHQYPNDYSGIPDAATTATPFMPSGLVALSSSNHAGHVPANQGYYGRGVATGDRNATRPLLDMTPQSQFAEGSLLRQMEKHNIHD